MYALILHDVDDWILGVGIHFSGVGISHAQNVPAEFDYGALHAQTNSQEWDFVFSRIADGPDFPLNATVAEAGGHQYTMQIPHFVCHIAFINLGGVNPINHHFGFI